MREILFRGKRIDTGEWVEGYYSGEDCELPWTLPIKKDSIIVKGVGLWVDIQSETLGQYTGMTDRNGKKIFEGDIIKGVGDELFVIEWHNGQFIAKCLHDWLFMFEAKTGEIVGNIHDNPELVERERESNG